MGRIATLARRAVDFLFIRIAHDRDQLILTRERRGSALVRRGVLLTPRTPGRTLRWCMVYGCSTCPGRGEHALCNAAHAPPA